MRICPIASGSSGNCIYVGSDSTHLIVDCGLSGKKTTAGINSLDLSMDDISAILITHEHSDHIGGLGVLARKYGIPIYTTSLTADAILNSSWVGRIDHTLFNDVSPDKPFMIGDIEINPMRVSHDAIDPVAYRFRCGDKRSAIVTDLGFYNDYIVEGLTGLDVLMIESNHDVNMLQVGPYPYPLKQRILGDKGHLSNENAGKLLSCVLHDNMKHIILGHLSHENNIPELAFESVRMEITASDTPYKGGDFPLTVAKRSEPTECVNF
ncbi:MAG: MBL fold metallo-hydrolase [Lachnospiraceae bacterium]|nr:MBL fold metallo-hydrolase [Lachnospiraceae bacterium]